MCKYGRNLELLYETPAELPVDRAPPKNSLKALIRSICQEGRTVLTEEESKRFLTAYKIPATPLRIAHNLDELTAIGKQMDYPAVLKVVSPDILHKTDVGGIALSIRSLAELQTRYGEMIGTVGQKAPKARIAGVSVQKMVEPVAMS